MYTPSVHDGAIPHKLYEDRHTRERFAVAAELPGQYTKKLVQNRLGKD
jgi:hypothetical protein